MLDAAPAVLGATGFIGSTGWYDYSLRNRRLDVPVDRYEAKRLPGVCTWSDGRCVRWRFTDLEFAQECLRQLARDYQRVEACVDQVVAVLHTVPFRELLYGPLSMAYEFCRAYMGSEGLGRLIETLPKVRYLFCGHCHGAAFVRRAGLQAFCVGGEYRKKRLVKLDLCTGRSRTLTSEAPEERAVVVAEDATEGRAL